MGDIPDELPLPPSRLDPEALGNLPLPPDRLNPAPTLAGRVPTGESQFATPDAGGQAPSQVQLPPREPGTSIASQPQPSRADFFRHMLGDFFYAAGTGLAAAGHGPGSFGRGLGAGLTALPNRDILNQQLEIQRQQAQGVAAYHQAQADALKNRYAPQVWTDANGVQHQLSADEFARLQAGLNRTATTQSGIDARAQAAQNNLRATMAKAQLVPTFDENGKVTDVRPMTREELTQQQQATLGQTQAKTADIAAARQEKMNEFHQTLQYKQWKEKLDTETRKQVAQLTAGKAPASLMQTAAFAQGGLTTLDNAKQEMDWLEQKGVFGQTWAKNKVEDWVFGKGAVDPSLDSETRYHIGKLRSSMELAAGAMQRAHTGRGMHEMYDDMKKMVGPGQDWDALRGAIDESTGLMTDYSNVASTENIQRLRGGGGGGGGNKPPIDSFWNNKK